MAETIPSFSDETNDLAEFQRRLKLLLASDAGWTRGEEARNEGAEFVPADSPSATNFRMDGFIDRCNPGSPLDESLINWFADHVSAAGMCYWNDNPYRREITVRNMLERICNLKAEELVTTPAAR